MTSKIHTQLHVCQNLHSWISWHVPDSVSSSGASLLFLSTLTKTGSWACLTFFWGCYNTWWLVLCSAPAHYHSSVKTFILSCFLCLSKAWECTRTTTRDMRAGTGEGGGPATFPCINLTRLTETLNTALNIKNKRHNWLRASSQDVGRWH